MPFNDMQELEFNFKWVGGEMPPDQVNSLMEFSRDNKNPKIIVWVDNEQTQKKLIAQMKPKRSTVTLSNVSFKIIQHDEIIIPKPIQELIEKCRSAKLWASMSDIYRLFILARKRSTDQTEHVRLYVEADNIMPSRLWSNFQEHEIAAIYNDDLHRFALDKFRTDLLLLDTTSEKGTQFMLSLRPNFVKLITDPLLAKYLSVLLEEANKRTATGPRGLAECDVLASTGALVSALFRMCFSDPNAPPKYGFQDILVGLSRVKKDVSFGSVASRSWINADKTPEIAFGALFRLILLRIAELTDPSGIMLKEAEEELQVGEEYFRACKDSILHYGGPGSVPLWLTEAEDLHKSLTTPVEKTTAGAKKPSP